MTEKFHSFFIEEKLNASILMILIVFCMKGIWILKILASIESYFIIKPALLEQKFAIVISQLSVNEVDRFSFTIRRLLGELVQG